MSWYVGKALTRVSQLVLRLWAPTQLLLARAQRIAHAIVLGRFDG